MKSIAFSNGLLIGLLIVAIVPFGAWSQTTVQPSRTFSGAEADQTPGGANTGAGNMSWGRPRFR